MSTPRVLLSTTCLTTVWLCVVPLPAVANPQGGVVSAGQASIVETGKKLDINQQSNKAVIDWRGFDIAPDEQTKFNQPNASAITLNRVNSKSASSINGQLSANGTVVIVNQNGVMFGKDAQVDVNGLIATSADIDNQQFMNSSKLQFDKAGKADAAIVNEGQITAKEAGLVGLVAPNVVNSGVINVKLGKAQLASGSTMTVDLYGDGLMQVAVGDEVKSQLVANSGLIQADGGTVALTAAAGKTIVNSLISNSGVLQAQSVGIKNGKIIIAAEGSTAVQGNVAANKGKKQGTSTVANSGVIDASGRKNGERGGKIEVTGDNVALLTGTLIDASGYEGKSGTTKGKKLSDVREGSAGGDIQIGGDYLGGGITPTALNLYVDSGALILNDALNSGDAGRTIFWSDNTTSFYGNVYARALGGKSVNALTWNATAGGNAGDGGFVETSGHGHLNAGGYVDLTSSIGNRGTYFLDPTDITIYGNFDPTDVSGLQLWLDATQITGKNNGDTLSSWDDVSVAARTSQIIGAGAIYNSAGINGHNTVTLSANNSFLYDMGTTLQNAHTVFLLAKPTSNAQDYAPLFGYTNSTHSSNGGDLIFFKSSLNFASYPAYNAGIGLENASSYAVNTAYLISLIMNPGTTQPLDVNGASIGSTTSSASYPAHTHMVLSQQGGISRWFTGEVGEVIFYNNAISDSNYGLLEQYQSAKWGTSLTPPGTGADENAKATASNGYSAFTTRYLERLSQSANVSLQATNNISLDLQGDTLNFATSARSLTLNAGNQISTASAGTITTNNGAISLTGTNGILFNHAFALNSTGGNITLNNAVTLGANTTLNAGAGALTFGSTVNGGYNFTATAGTFSFASALGGASRLGTVDFISTGDLTLGAITANSVTAQAVGHLTAGGAIDSNGNAISLTADSNADNSGNLTINGALTSTNAAIALAGAQMDINTTVDAGTSTVTLKPKTAKDIHIAGSTDNNDGVSSFDISSAEMGRIKAGTLSIGDASLASAMSVDGDIDLTGLSNAAGVFNLSFNTAGTFDSSGRTINLGRNAVSLDGSNDYIHVADGYTTTVSGDNTTSISFWFNARSVSNDPVLLDAEDGGYFDSFHELSSSRGFYWSQGSYRTYAGSAFSLNQWNHAVFVKTGATTGDLYLNGSIYGSYSGNLSNTPSAVSDLLIGKFKTGYNFNGLMDNVRIYDRSLSGAEVTALYNSGAGDALSGAASGLKASYIFNEGTGTTVADGSGFSNSGTLTNGPTWVRAQNFTVNAGGAATFGAIYGDGSNISLAGNSIALAGQVAAMGNGTLSIVATNNITLNSGSSAQAGNSGNSLVLRSSAGNFINNSGLGSSTLSAPNGRWIVYSQSAGANTAGGLTAPQTINGQTYGTLAPAAITEATYSSTQNTWVYSASAGGIITITADNFMRYYGNSNPSFTYSFACSTSCTEVDAITGAPSLTTMATSGTAIGTATIVAGLGSILLNPAYSGYTFSFVDGTLTIDPRVLTLAGAVANNKVYNRSTAATLDLTSASLNNVVSGEEALVSLNSSGLSASFATYSVGTGKSVNVSGLSLSGAGASNYTLTQPSSLTANITAKGLSLTGLSAANKVYDASTNASLTGTGSLSGVESGDTVGYAAGTASFADKTVASGKTVTATGFSLTGGDAGNYTLTQPGTWLANITAKGLSLTGLSAANKVYDASTNASLTGTGSLSGVESGDTVGYAAGTASFADKTVASGKTVTATGFSLTGGDAGNYTLTQPGTWLANITAKGLSLTGLSAANKVYDASTNASLTGTGSLSGVESGDTVGYAAGTASFADKTVASGKTVTATGFSLTGGDAGNYTLTQPGTWLANITAKGLSLTGLSAANKVYDASTNASLTGTGSLSGVESGDTVGYAAGTASFADKTVASGKTVTATGFSLTGGDAGNYTLTQPGTWLANITAKGLSLTGLSAANKVYDASTNASLTGTGSLSGVESGDTVGYAAGTASFADKTVASGKTVTATGFSLTGGDAGNYTLTQPGTWLANITAKGLSLTGLSAANKVYDASTSASLTGTGSLSGVESGDTVGYAAGTASFADKTVASGKTVTATGFSLTGGDAGNYTLTQPGTWLANITAKGLSLTGLSAANKVYDASTNASLTGTGSLSGVESGDTVGYAAGTASFADKTVASGKTVTATGFSLTGGDAGNYTLTQPGTWLANITAKGLTLLGINASSKTYDGTTLASVNAASATFTGKEAGDTVALNSGIISAAFVDQNAGVNKVVTVSGLSLSGADAANYTLNLSSFSGTTATISPKSVSVIANAQSKIYGQNDPSLSYSYAGLVSGDNAGVFNGGLSRASGQDVGNYAIQQGSLIAGNNYNITFTDALLSVTPASLLITANDAARVQGQANPAFTASYAGLQYADTPSVVSGLALTTPAGATAQPGIYPIIAVNGLADNYTISFVNGILDILPAPIPSTVVRISQEPTLVPSIDINTSLFTRNDDRNSQKPKPLDADTLITASQPDAPIADAHISTWSEYIKKKLLKNKAVIKKIAAL